MAEAGDILKEWHQAKTPEKLLIVGISIAAVGIAIYVHSKTASAASTTPSTTIQTGGTPSNGGTVGTTPSGPTGTPTAPPTTPSTPAKPTTPTANPIIKGKVTPKAPAPVFHANPIIHGTVTSKTARASVQHKIVSQPAPTAAKGYWQPPKPTAANHTIYVRGNAGSGPRVRTGPSSAPVGYKPQPASKPLNDNIHTTGHGYAP